jgi:hypothetical protein
MSFVIHNTYNLKGENDYRELFAGSQKNPVYKHKKRHHKKYYFVGLSSQDFFTQNAHVF